LPLSRSSQLDGLANRDRWQPVPAAREVTTCRVVEDVQTRIVGYQVTYDYRTASSSRR